MIPARATQSERQFVSESPPILRSTANIKAMVAAATAQCATVAPKAPGPPQDRSSSSVEAPAAQNG